MQDAAMRALQALATVSVDRPKPWFLAIVRNAAMTFMARNRRKTMAYVGDMTDLDSARFARKGDEAAPNAEQELIALEDGERLRQAIAAPPLALSGNAGHARHQRPLVSRDRRSDRDAGRHGDVAAGARARHARQDPEVADAMTDRDAERTASQAQRRPGRRTRRHGLARVRARAARRSRPRRRVPAPHGAARRGPRHAPREAAPQALADRIAALAASAPAAPPPQAAAAPTATSSRSGGARGSTAARWRWPPPSRVLGFAVGAGLTSLRAPAGSGDVAQHLVSDFARAEIAGQPFDVASSDRHTVKPWLANRTTVSGTIVDLASDGFPLVGGRVTIVDRIPTPTLVYRHNEHVVAVTELPLDAKATAAEQAQSKRSTATMWRAGPMRTSPMSQSPTWTRRRSVNSSRRSGAAAAPRPSRPSHNGLGAACRNCRRGRRPRPPRSKNVRKNAGRNGLWVTAAAGAWPDAVCACLARRLRQREIFPRNPE